MVLPRQLDRERSGLEDRKLDESSGMWENCFAQPRSLLLRDPKILWVKRGLNPQPSGYHEPGVASEARSHR